MSEGSLKRVCFIGIGNMGWPMAARLLKAGYQLDVADAVAGRADKFVAEVGGAAVKSPSQSAKQADVIITMLPTSAHVVAVIDEIRPGLSAGKIVIDMSSGA